MLLYTSDYKFLNLKTSLHIFRWEGEGAIVCIKKDRWVKSLQSFPNIQKFIFCVFCLQDTADIYYLVNLDLLLSGYSTSTVG